MDPNTIAAVLQACCSPNTAERQAGEEELRKVRTESPRHPRTREGCV